MNLNTETWKEFKIGDLFQIRPINHYGLTNDKLYVVNGKNKVIANTSQENGIGGYTNLENTEKGNMITFSDTTDYNSIFYQPVDFVGYSHVQGLYPLKFKKKWNKQTYLFFLTVFRKNASGKGFSYANKFNRKIASEIRVKLPAIDEETPDFEFMEEYIKYIENKHIEKVDKFNKEEINKALKVTGLSEKDLDGDLTVEPAGMYCEFKIKELFDVLSSKKIFHATELDIYGVDVYRKNKTDLSPYVVRSELNNGVRGYISEPSSFLNNENTISFAQDTFIAYYQKIPYFTGNKIKILEPLFNPKERILLYIETAINKSIASNTWGTGSTVNYIENIKLILPAIDEKTPDFEFMEKAIYIYIYDKLLDLGRWITKKK